MGAALRTLRGSLSFLAAMAWFALLIPVCYLVALPLALLLPSKRHAIVSSYMKLNVWGLLTCMEMGGAHFERRGALPTAGPSLVIMNHQSQLDILTVTMLGRPYVPAFVPRELYARWYIPSVSVCIRLLGSPIVDPRRDPKGAVETIRAAALTAQHGLLIFPEGHRSLDGELRPFKTAGTLAFLEARRLPVYLVVTDGYWRGRRFVDFLANVPHLRGVTEVLGPFEPPVAAAELPAFLDSMRERIAQRLRERRAA
jgi:1-acyl-sn-glycerol-3-phosphate acyltransferase